MQNSEAISPIISRPRYAAAFRCIGSDCEDMCCGDWEIPVDRETYEKYRQFPADKLGPLVSQFVVINTPPQPNARRRIHADQRYRDVSRSVRFFEVNIDLPARVKARRRSSQPA